MTMGVHKKASTQEYDRRILKAQIKEEIKAEMKDYIDEFISGRVNAVVGPVIVEMLGKFMDFPLNIRQLAALMGRTEDNVYKMCQRYKIPYTKTRGVIHVNLKDINRQLLDLKGSE